MTSADTDSLYELDREGNILWEWCAHDHGYTEAHLGGPVDSPSTLPDYRPYTCLSGHHAVHPNSATYHYTTSTTTEGEKGRGTQECHSVLATLFHTGSLVKIDRKTGAIETILEGLHHPHAIRPLPGRTGYSLCDTEKGNVLLLHPDTLKVRLQLLHTPTLTLTPRLSSPLCM